MQKAVGTCAGLSRLSQKTEITKEQSAHSDQLRSATAQVRSQPNEDFRGGPSRTKAYEMTKMRTSETDSQLHLSQTPEPQRKLTVSAMDYISVNQCRKEVKLAHARASLACHAPTHALRARITTIASGSTSAWLSIWPLFSITVRRKEATAAPSSSLAKPSSS
eukprot:1886267-Pleurochrysis_carterae.AAC.1